MQQETSRQLSLIIPAYNEVDRIGGTIGSIQKYLDGQGYRYELIIAADGDDGTRERVAEFAARDPRISVLGSAQRSGKGRGVRQGVLRARGEIIGYFDADYKTPIEEIEKVMPWFEQGFDLVIGSRRLGESSVQVPQRRHRRLGSKAFGWVRSALVGLGDIRDTQCGFKFMSRQAAKEIFSRQRLDSYIFDVEVLYLARQLGYRIKEVGVQWQDDGDTRSSPVGNSIRFVRDLMQIRLHHSRRRIAVHSRTWAMA